MSRAGRFWTQAEIDQTIALAREGLSAYEIGKRIDIDRKLVVRKLDDLADEIGPVKVLEKVWTPERVEQLRKLIGDGYSHTQAAAEIGGGITRNACIGKAGRMGIHSVVAGGDNRRFARPRSRTRNTPFRRPSTRAPFLSQPSGGEGEPTHHAPPIAVCEAVDPDAPPAGGMLFADLRDGCCRWPYGDHAPFLFCGAATSFGSWCAVHARKVFAS